jgi:hypothetical protein
MTWKTIARLVMLAATSMLAGCGSGGSNGTNSTTAVVAFSLVSTARLPQRISGVTIAIHLPTGVSVQTDTANPKQISSTVLVAGSAMASIPSIILGSYSSAGRMVRIVSTTNVTSGFGPGEYARLTCLVAHGVTITESGLTTLNTPPVMFKVAGFDATTNSTVDLTNLLQPHFTVP